jgi:hypothetical protein
MRAAKKILLASRQGPQLALSYEKRDKNGGKRGGKREGAGRKRVHHTLPTGKRYEPHLARTKVDKRHPQHVNLPIVGNIASLRTRDLYAAVRNAILVAHRSRDNFRIVHHSVQTHHIHLVVEADDKPALASGMKGFEISLARRVNAIVSRRRGMKRSGQVVADRYHVTAMTSVRGTRNALCYVLNNWRHHPQSARGTAGLYDGRLDPFSSAIWFVGWKERSTPEVHIPPGYDPPLRVEPRTWLLREGWKRAKPISCWEVPG